MSRPHVIIIGAGLGGLALAQGLTRAGIGVTVHERDATAEFRNQGYRIRINTDGIAALRAVLTPRAYDLFIATAGMPGGRMDTYDHRLRLRQAHTLPEVPHAPGGGHLAVNRRTLRQILLAGLEDRVRFGAEFTHSTTEPSGAVTAHFADGTSATGSVLVGADGVGSAVRRQHFPRARVMDAGLRLLYGKVPIGTDAAGSAGSAGSAEILPEQLHGLWTTIVGPDRRFVGLAPVHYREPLPQAASRIAPDIALDADTDYLTCVVGARRELFPVPDTELFALDGVALRTFASTMTEGWHPLVRELLLRQDPATIFPVTVRSSVPFAGWETGSVTLLGDAVHAMSPAIGVGANTALRDAQVLAGRLSAAGGGRSLTEALHAYETEMFDYGFHAVRDSAERGNELVGQNPLPETADA